jgi:hypothetical protein
MWIVEDIGLCLSGDVDVFAVLERGLFHPLDIVYARHVAYLPDLAAHVVAVDKRPLAVGNILPHFSSNQEHFEQYHVRSTCKCIYALLCGLAFTLVVFPTLLLAVCRAVLFFFASCANEQCLSIISFLFPTGCTTNFRH